MRQRTAVCLSLVALGACLAAFPAQASAPQQGSHNARACMILTDPAGDTRLVLGRPGPSPDQEGSLDLLSADFASTKDNLIVVIRLRSLATPAPASQGGVGYDATFSANGQSAYDVSAAVMPDGNWFSISGPSELDAAGAASNKPYLADLTGSIDTAHNLVRIVIPRKVLVHLAHHAPINMTSVSTYRAVGSATAKNVTHAGDDADSASDARTYYMDQPSCAS